MFKKLLTISLMFFSLILIPAVFSYSYVIPTEENGAEFFYVFGKEGKPGYGANDNILILFAAIPKNTQENLLIKIFDPGLGERNDEREGEWDTSTKFSVYGGQGAFTDSRARKNFLIKDYDTGRLLYKTVFSDKEKYDDHWVYLGPFVPAQGEQVGDYYIFKIIVEGLEGNDNNLFKFDITPDSTEVFSYNISIRLSEERGKHMKFFPFFQESTQAVEITNFDLDIDGAHAYLKSETSGKKHKIDKSYSSKYKTTLVEIKNSQNPQKWTLNLVKEKQNEANAVFSLKDIEGIPVRIYFRPKLIKPQLAMSIKSGELQCNEFIFDATSSYDINKLPLTFLWNFGDGQTSSEPVVKHEYKEAGEYTVKLTVRNNSGLPCDTSETTKKVKVNAPPKAHFESADIYCVNKKIVFDASRTEDSDSDILSYYWDFGDSTTSKDKITEKSYSQGGTYTVTLKVDDNQKTSCSTDILKKTIYVNTPPVADAGKDINLCLNDRNENYIIEFDASGSKDADGNNLKYIWDFDDGQKGQGQKTSHVYKTSGKYTVKLTVDDNTNSKCSISEDTLSLMINKPPLADAGKDRYVCAGDTVEFDGSLCTTEPSEKLNYTWECKNEFKENTAKINHKFKKGGIYKVNLTADDNQNTECSSNTDIITVKVNSKPEAVFSILNKGCVNTPVKFDASASKDADETDTLTFLWDFGDGQTSSEPVVKHEYKKGGEYTVTLTVDDGKNLHCSKSSSVKHVKINTPPIADAGPNLACCVNTETFFDASGSYDDDNDTLTYTWDFGDSTKASGEKVFHTYTKPGKYTVILTVDDQSKTECSTAVSSFIAIVEAKPVPIIKIIKD